MTEILTESFCERCGTRYTFESSAPRRSRVGRVRTLSKGVRNFVLSDDSSFSEAMADARSEEELSATAHQLDAFHKTFNFCLTCRQYTCGTCWNQAEGRCLTCAPMPGVEVAGDHVHEIPADANGHALMEIDEAWPEADLERINAVLGQPPALEAPEAPQAPEALEEPAPAASAAIDPARWAEADELADHEVLQAGEMRPADEILLADEIPLGDEVPHGEAPVAEPLAGEPAAVSPVEDVVPGEQADWAATAATAATAETSGVDLIGVAPGQSLEDAIAAYETRLEEQELAEAEAAAHATTDEPAAKDTEDAQAAEAAALAATAAAAAMSPAALDATPTDEPATFDQAAPDDLAATPDLAPDAAPQAPEPAAAEPPMAPPPAPTPAPADVIAQPTWPVAPTSQPTSDGVPGPASAPPAPPAPQPTTPPASAPGQDTTTPSSPWLRVAPDNDGAPAPQWPAAPRWPAASGREMPTTLAGRPLLPRDDASALWAASAREVLGPVAAGGPAPAVTAAPQPCVQCGLSLSANARFCRRCGSRQG